MRKKEEDIKEKLENQEADAVKNSPAKDLTEGSPMKLIIGFALPMLLGLLFQQCYSLIDTMIVGNYLGVNPFAGVSSTGSLNFITIGFCTGLCSGFAIPVAQFFGAKDYVNLRKTVANSIWLCVGFGVVFTTLMLVFCRPILKLMNTPEDIFEYAHTYIFIIFAGVPCTILYNVTASMIRSLGDSKSPIIFLAISSVLNIGLDLLFIVVFGMNVEGAALATVISQGVAGIVCVIYMRKKFEILHMQSGEMKPELDLMKKLTGIGIPMGLQYSITGIGSVILQGAVNGLGSVYVASMGAGIKIQILLVCPLEALGQTMAPYAGQNVGAKKLDRVWQGLKAACVIGFVTSAVMFVAVRLGATRMIHLFLKNPETAILENSAYFLEVVSIYYCLLTIVNTWRFTIQGMGYSTFAVIAGILEMIARALAGILLVPHFGFFGACIASPLAWLFADAFLIPAFFWCRKRTRIRLENGLEVI